MLNESYLAQGDALEGIIFFVIVGIIWLLSAIASAYQKFQKRQRERERQLRGFDPMMKPAPPPLARQAPQPMMSSRKEPRRQQQRSQTVPLPKKSHPKAIRPLPPEIVITEPVSKQPYPSKRKARPLPPPPPVQRAFVPVEEVREAQVAVEKPVIAPVRPRVSADAGALRGWLTPGTLKSQFILTEILQPPLALRSERAVF